MFLFLCTARNTQHSNTKDTFKNLLNWYEFGFKLPVSTTNIRWLYQHLSMHPRFFGLKQTFVHLWNSFMESRNNDMIRLGWSIRYTSTYLFYQEILSQVLTLHFRSFGYSNTNCRFFRMSRKMYSCLGKFIMWSSKGRYSMPSRQYAMLCRKTTEEKTKQKSNW